MMFLEFSIYIILISTSGVMSPGPLFFVNLYYGSKYGPFNGLKIALGHTIVELPLIIFFFYGLDKFSSLFLSEDVLKVIGTIGGTFMIFFSLLQIYSIKKNKFIESDNNESKSSIRSPLFIGVIFTALNPFFLIWWSTIGLKLVSDSINFFGFYEGITILFFSHIWMDYFWLGATSFMAFKGRSIIKEKYYTVILLSFSIFIALFGIYFLFDIYWPSQ